MKRPVPGLVRTVGAGRATGWRPRVPERPIGVTLCRAESVGAQLIGEFTVASPPPEVRAIDEAADRST